MGVFDFLFGNKAKKLIAAGLTGQISIVEELLDKGVDVNAENDDGVTALMAASLNGHEEIVNKLLNRGANIHLQDRNGWTSLMYAAYTGYDKIIARLLSKGANINLQDHNGLTALMIAVNPPQNKIIGKLLKGNANILKKKNELNQNPKSKNTTLMQLLLKKGANINICDNKGKSVIVYMIDKGYIENLKILLTFEITAVNARFYDLPILSLAILKNDIEIVKLLLNKKVDITAKDRNGWTALMVATANKRIKIIDLLKKFGAKE
jgi:serine/threonine-protein phosphatase 6 regulatory ankyrin repeat subunit B